MRRKIYVVGDATDYANWMDGDLVYKLEDADLVVFTGGADITPAIYNEPKHPKTFFIWERDKREMAAFKRALRLKKHMIGICRGAQFLCVMNGGKLVQHQENWNYFHKIYTHDGQTFRITSEHHQAMYPFNLPTNEYKILARSKEQSKFHLDGNMKELKFGKEECEIVYFPRIKSLGIQGHPEWINRHSFDPIEESAKHTTLPYLQDLLDKHMEDAII